MLPESTPPASWAPTGTSATSWRLHRLAEEPVELLAVLLVGGPVVGLGEVEVPITDRGAAAPLPAASVR